MSFDKAEVLIIGSGAMGLATAYYLNRKGIRHIKILEKDNMVGGYSTSRCAGGFRHQFSNEINILLSALSYELLLSYEKDFGLPSFIDACGYLFPLCEEDNIRGFEKAYELQHSVSVRAEWLSKKQVQNMVPHMDIDSIVCGTYYKKDGLIDAYSLTNFYLNQLDDNGIKTELNTEVLNIEVADNSVKGVVTSKGYIDVPIVINCTGPWSGQILKNIGISLPLTVSKQQLLLCGELPFSEKNYPVTIFSSSGLGFHKEGGNLLCGLHNPAEETEFLFDDSIDYKWNTLQCKSLLKRLPVVRTGKVKSIWTGYYDMTPDLNPIVGELSIKGLYNASGFSGHGLMHSPASGMLLSERIIEGAYQTLDISGLEGNRFEEKGTQVEFYKI